MDKMMVRRVVGALVATLTFGLILGILYFSQSERLFIFVARQQAERAKAFLLYKTDHQVLLEACRELSAQVTGGSLKSGTYWVNSSTPDPEVSQFPQVIVDIGPSYVHIDENDSGRVMLEMLGGALGHFGVIAYAEGYKEPSHAERGDRQLVPGLWYYDDEYDSNPEYDKRIEALIGRRKR